jgi:bifunctional DNA-binding transcriptional regulator/antitoxin component of YhaV-PrlF toxin-antitoxin module
MSVAVKITEKGQITIPREIRNVLKADLISFSVVDGVVILRPLSDVGGSLHAYVRNAASTASFRDQKEAAWEEAIREKINR